MSRCCLHEVSPEVAAFRYWRGSLYTVPDPQIIFHFLKMFYLSWCYSTKAAFHVFQRCGNIYVLSVFVACCGLKCMFGFYSTGRTSEMFGCTSLVYTDGGISYHYFYQSFSSSISGASVDASETYFIYFNSFGYYKCIHIFIYKTGLSASLKWKHVL